MHLNAIQQTITDRLNADAYFVANGITVRKGFSARVSADGELDSEVKGDLETRGVSLVIGMPQIDTADVSRSGRALLRVKVDVDIVENPTQSRSDSGLDIDPNTLALEVIQALIGHPEITTFPDNNFRVTHDENMGLFVYQVSLAVQSTATGR